MRAVSGIKSGEFVVRDVSQLRLQAGPFIYAATPQGVPFDSNMKPIVEPKKIGEFMAASTQIADELRAQFAKKVAEAAEAKSPAQPRKAASEK